MNKFYTDDKTEIAALLESSVCCVRHKGQLWVVGLDDVTGGLDENGNTVFRCQTAAGHIHFIGALEIFCFETLREAQANLFSVPDELDAEIIGDKE